MEKTGGLEVSQPESIVLPNKLTKFGHQVSAGYIPNSARVMRVTAANFTSGQTTSATPLNFVIAPMERKAIIGDSAMIVLRCTALKSDNSVIDSSGADNISLREEAGNYLVRHVVVTVDRTQLNSGNDVNIARHIKDRYFSSSKRGEIGERLVNADTEMVLNRSAITTSSDYYKGYAIQNGKTFDIIRVVDELPMFGATDGLIPGFLTIGITATLNTNFSTVFTAPNTTAAPLLKISSVELVFTVVDIEPGIYQALARSYVDRGITMNVSKWEVMNIGTIPTGSLVYSSLDQIIRHSPDILGFFMFNAAQIAPAAGVNAAVFDDNPFTSYWGNLDVFSISSQGTTVFSLNNVAGSKASLLQLLNNSVTFSQNSEVLQYGGVNAHMYASEKGLGGIVFPFRNFDEQSSVFSAAPTFKIEMSFSTATTVQLSLYMVYRARVALELKAGSEARIVN